MPASEVDEAPHPSPPRGRALLTLSLASLGVVYGDIGTSPLYAMRECFAGHHPLAVTPANVLGVLSLMTWSLLLVVTLKYLVLVLRANNRGEGGILALMALVQQTRRRTGVPGLLVLAVGLFGAALLYGDGVITPAISVLSAVEGIAVMQPALQPYALPAAIGILAGLFALQRRGTGRVGALFGPITLVWFATLSVLGLRALLARPEVLAAFNPIHAVRLMAYNGEIGFLVLGAVFLVVTGGEALYADMGHFGLRPIRVTWVAVVLPALLLNYYGQGALLLSDATALENPFYKLAPAWAVGPLVALATAAACIASQAVISGAFSLTRQAVQLGFCPRMEIVHTSGEHIGQIYVPAVNWALLLAVVALVVGFGSSSALAAAYGIAVSSTMGITTSLAFLIAKDRWRWPVVPSALLFGALLVIDLSFLAANGVKFLDGGWFPLVLAAAVFVLMSTWRRGRTILAERLQAAAIPLDQLIEGLRVQSPPRVPGTAVFMTGSPGGAPPALLHNLKHNKALHERVVLLTVTSEEVPHATGDRIELEPMDLGFQRVRARYGFMETPDVPALLRELGRAGMPLRLMETSFFLGRETLIPSGRYHGMARWRKQLFGWMAKNARSATAYFGLPPNRVVELGTQVEL